MMTLLLMISGCYSGCNHVVFFLLFNFNLNKDLILSLGNFTQSITVILYDQEPRSSPMPYFCMVFSSLGVCLLLLRISTWTAWKYLGLLWVVPLKNHGELWTVIVITVNS